MIPEMLAQTFPEGWPPAFVMAATPSVALSRTYRDLAVNNRAKTLREMDG